MHPDASEWTQMHPSRSEQVRTGPKPSKNVRTLQTIRERIEKSAKSFETKYENKLKKILFVSRLSKWEVGEDFELGVLQNGIEFERQDPQKS